MKRYDILDLTKFILSFMIVAIHTHLFPMILYPWLRISVPLFLMISSYLLFIKINENPQKKWEIIRKYIIRQIKLYFFWFIVLSPITYITRKEWFDNGIINGGMIFIKQLLFSSTFIGSWYIVATITATIIISKLSEKVSDKILFLFFLVIFVICCLISSYNTFFENTKFVEVYNFYKNTIASPIYSFPVALIWIFIGKMFADNKINIKKNIYVLILVISSTLIYIEWRYVRYLDGTYNNDCYFFLLPLSFSIFGLILKKEITLKNPKVLRKISTIMYPLHASIAYVINYILQHYISNENILGIFSFVITISICFISCIIIFKLEDKKGFKILRYSH